MYGIIYCKGGRVYFAQNEDGSVCVFETLREADEMAESESCWRSDEVRVVSLG